MSDAVDETPDSEVEELSPEERVKRFNEEFDALSKKYDITTVDQLIQRIEAAGYTLDCYRVSEHGIWTCNIGRPEPGNEIPDAPSDFHEYAQGFSIEQTLELALYNAQITENYSHMVARKKIRRCHWDHKSERYVIKSADGWRCEGEHKPGLHKPKA